MSELTAFLSKNKCLPFFLPSRFPLFWGLYHGGFHLPAGHRITWTPLIVPAVLKEEVKNTRGVLGRSGWLNCPWMIRDGQKGWIFFLVTRLLVLPFLTFIPYSVRIIWWHNQGFDDMSKFHVISTFGMLSLSFFEAVSLHCSLHSSSS